MEGVRVTTGKAHYTTEIMSREHTVVADEPIPLGANLGPTPYELLLMALGSCISITLRMYADRKGWNLEEIQVVLQQERIHGKDCADCETKDAFVHQIHKNLTFKGNLTDAQRSRLLEISEKCPVQKTLLGEIKIRNESI